MPASRPEKYTAEFVGKELANMLEEAKADKDMVILGELFDCRDYSPQRFSEWEEKFRDNAEISESIKILKGLFERRLNLGGLQNRLNATMTIFNLKNNYGWKDKMEQDVTTNGESLNTGKLTAEELLNLHNLTKKASD